VQRLFKIGERLEALLWEATAQDIPIPERRSRRSLWDEALRGRIGQVSRKNFEVYGVRKMWREVKRREETVARCTVYRFMRQMGIQGAGRKFTTTTNDRRRRGREAPG
jgi:hypothetical protein